jgi:hypothetical protein
LALRSTVWIVPFLMFFEVTTIVAAVALATATSAATTAAIAALLIANLLSPGRTRVADVRDGP